MVSACMLPPVPNRPTKVVTIPRYHPKRLQKYPAVPIMPLVKPHDNYRKRKLGFGLLPPIVVDSRLLEFSRTRTRLNLVIINMLNVTHHSLECYDMAEILLTLALNTNQSINQSIVNLQIL